MSVSLRSLVLSASVLGLSACASMSDDGWVRLVDGEKGLDNFTTVGVADWRAVEGGIEAKSGGATPAYLLSKQSFRNFALRAEFWASEDANSGIFLRCQDRAVVTDENCYEVNIFDQRPDPTYATGAIVKVAKVEAPIPKAGGRWNTFEITAQGNRLIVMLNGVKTADVLDNKLAEGPIGLQWGRGIIKFKTVQVKPL